jgi:carboxypeptidase C (cathepsin A)
VLEGVDPRSYFSNKSDAQQLVQLIVEWCSRHHRLDSPKYLFGESYGTMRAAGAADQLQRLPTPLPLAGVVLMGQALNIIEFSQRPANVTSYVVSLPTLAAIAWSHGKAQTDGRDFQAFIDEVQGFARTEYLTALFQGSALDQSTRERIAARLEKYTGLPAGYYLSHALKITKERYRRELFRDEKQILGMTDARYVGPLSPSGGGDPASVVYLAYEAAFNSYLHTALGVGQVGEYVTQSPVADLADWKWDGTGISPFADWPYMSSLTEVFSLNPQFRVMVVNGWQDTQTTVGAAILAVDQSGWPRDRVSTRFYQGGHMAYSVEATLEKLTQDLRTFLTPAP